MRRKIVKLGPATLVVSLPSKWTKQFNLNAGDELDLEQQSSNIILSTEKSFGIKKETVDLTKTDSLIKRIVASKYLKGADEIEVKFDSSEKSRIIQKRVDEMIGMEIVEQGKDRLLLKDIGGASEENFETILKRVLFLLNQISDETLKAVKNKETDLQYLEDMELNINRFTDYCFRLLNKKGYSDMRKTAVYYCIVFLLEDLGDCYKKLISYIDENKVKLNPEEIRLCEKINKYHKDFEKLFLKFDYGGAIELAKERDKMIKEISRSKQKDISKHFENITETIIKMMGQLLNLP